MTTQSDIKKLAEQMASSMSSVDDIKDFQKQLMQSFIDTALVNTPFLTQHHRRIIKPPACTQQVSYH